MLKDYEIKDTILECLIKNGGANSYCSDESVALFIKISNNRAAKFLEEIFNDSYCNRQPGYGNTKYVYKPNADTETFLKFGGYTKLAKEQIEKGDLEMQKLRGEIDVIANTLIDYSTVKKRASRSELISWFALAIAFIGVIIQFKSCGS